MRKVSYSTELRLSVGLFILNLALSSAVWASLPKVDYDGLEAKAKSRVFRVVIQNQFGQRGGGTGFLVETENFGKVILTNRHICDSKSEDGVFVLEQQEKIYFTKISRVSTRSDLCLLEVTKAILESTEAYKFGKTPKSGQHVLVFGHPYLGKLVMNHGDFLDILMFPAQPGEPPEGLLAGIVDFPIRPGNSGSPLLNNKNEVVGIMFAMGLGDRGLFIPLESINRFLNGEE